MGTCRTMSHKIRLYKRNERDQTALTKPRRGLYARRSMTAMADRETAFAGKDESMSAKKSPGARPRQVGHEDLPMWAINSRATSAACQRAIAAPPVASGAAGRVQEARGCGAGSRSVAFSAEKEPPPRPQGEPRFSGLSAWDCPRPAQDPVL